MTVPSVALAPSELDRPIARASCRSWHGARRRSGGSGSTTPREALFHLPFRYDDFSELRAARRAGRGREAVGRGARHRRQGRAGLRPATAAGHRAARRRQWQRGGDLVRAPLRRAPAHSSATRCVVSGKVTMHGWRPQFTRPSSRRPAASPSTPRASCRSIRSTAGVTQKRLRELLARDPGSRAPSASTTRCRRRARRAAAARRRARTRPLSRGGGRRDGRARPTGLRRAARPAAHAGAGAARARPRCRRRAVDGRRRGAGRLLGALPFDAHRRPGAGASTRSLADLARSGRCAACSRATWAAARRPSRRVALAGAVRAGWQAALMAPTEILARQHHAGLAPLLEALGVRAEFLSGSLGSAPRSARSTRPSPAAMAEVVIGTHAVISEASSSSGWGWRSSTSSTASASRSGPRCRRRGAGSSRTCWR